ncbi:hypothetical protein GUJ93_ZPchr0002g24297 [Zizania palustris]|uniref:Uncharacterized protein n=1 Tax=Zizania palustris TaxID=103762 RepID=A0A8J5RXS1_ZIZPA|nr:hypothetical protein GUJ93_ZPchr0002g24297 [Zizania palustris]
MEDEHKLPELELASAGLSRLREWSRRPLCCCVGRCRRRRTGRSESDEWDELYGRFLACLRWMCVDHSSTARSAGSWVVFLLLAIAAPLGVQFTLPGSAPQRPFVWHVQVSLIIVASLANLSLYELTRGGLQRMLYLNRLRRDSEDVPAGYTLGYTLQLSRSFRLLAYFVGMFSLFEAAYKVYWYFAAASFHSPWWSAAGCVIEIVSWVYRTAVFFMVCILFRLICHLQILRMMRFAQEFTRSADVADVLEHHHQIKDHLRSISHEYRRFILLSIVVVTASQFAALLATTRPHAEINLATAGELVLCSFSLIVGLLLCLYSAAKITHRTQAITSVAAEWHANVTIRAINNDLDNPSYFKKRQALVTYLENNRAGITVYGFVMDRTWLHALFMIELSLVLWLLGKTVGISPAVPTSDAELRLTPPGWTDRMQI